MVPIGDHDLVGVSTYTGFAGAAYTIGRWEVRTGRFTPLVSFPNCAVLAAFTDEVTVWLVGYDSVGAIDLATASLRWQRGISRPGSPENITADADALHFADRGPHASSDWVLDTVSKTTGETLGVVPVEFGPNNEAIPSDEGTWRMVRVTGAGAAEIRRYDLATGAVAHRLTVDPGPGGFVDQAVVTGSTLWTVTHVGPDKTTISHRDLEGKTPAVPLALRGARLSYGPSGLWAMAGTDVTFKTDSVTYFLYRIDPSTSGVQPVTTFTRAIGHWRGAHAIVGETISRTGFQFWLTETGRDDTLVEVAANGP